jgi:hypothetical protein
LEVVTMTMTLATDHADADLMDGDCQCCCCTGECASQGYELEDALSLGMVEGDYE